MKISDTKREYEKEPLYKEELMSMPTSEIRELTNHSAK